MGKRKAERLSVAEITRQVMAAMRANGSDVGNPRRARRGTRAKAVTYRDAVATDAPTVELTSAKGKKYSRKATMGLKNVPADLKTIMDQWSASLTPRTPRVPSADCAPEERAGSANPSGRSRRSD